MTHRDDRDAKFRHLLLSTSAVMAFAVAAPGAFAQVQGDDFDTAVPDSAQTQFEEDEIVVTGIRAALATAADIKRNADTAVDSITSSDVSSLPDLSVAEALARVPGVVVQRIALDDSLGGDFPSPEGGGNLVRGLTLVRSELNGRDAFSANEGRSLDFGTIPPELIGAVDVYKNTAADLIEGGLGGSINLRTLEPFDRSDRVAVVTLDGTYTDLRDEVSPEGSILLGDRWETGAGEFGLLGSVSYSELKSDLNGFQVGQYTPLRQEDGSFIATPSGFQLRTNEVDRERESYYIAGQYENNAGDFQLTGKYVRIDNQQTGRERTFEGFPDGESFAGENNDILTGRPTSLTGVSLTSVVSGLESTPFNSAVPACNGNNDPNPSLALCETLFPVTGLYESGVISNSNRAWASATDFPISGLSIFQDVESMTDDLSLNAKWRVNDRLFVNLDGHYTTAESDVTRIWGGTRSFANFEINTDLDDPTVTLTRGEGENNPIRAFADGSFQGGFFGGGTPLSADLSDPANSFLLFVSDQFQENDGDLYALRGDVEYEFDGDGWFDAVKFGARYADREQTNRIADQNWRAVSPPWQGQDRSNPLDGCCAGYVPLSELQDQSAFDIVDFSDFFRGDTVLGENQAFPFVSIDLLEDYFGLIDFLRSEPLVAANIVTTPVRSETGEILNQNNNERFPGTVDRDIFFEWIPYRQENVDGGAVNFDRPGFASVSDIQEQTISAYARVDFGGEIGETMSIDGNFGLRYTETQISGDGLIDFQPLLDDSGDPVEQRFSAFVPDAQAFLDQDPIAVSGDFRTDNFWLPSFNAKWNLSDEHQMRFGVSKNISRPRLEQLRPGQIISASTQTLRELLPPPQPGVDPGRPNVIDRSLRALTVTGGNPNLRPIESWNYDVSYETYWGGQNSLTASLFHKQIDNNIVFGTENLGTETLDGVQVPVVYQGFINLAESELTGLELAYQQFYEELPGPLGNLGLQANYTYIAAESDAPAPGPDSNGDGISDDPLQIFRFDVPNFLGLSEHTANVIGIYQDDDWEFRLAYNWRSDYLSSYRDFVTGNPIFQEDVGFLDGSIRWDVNENIQFRVQAANLLNTRTKATQQVDPFGTRLSRTSFIGDRRIKFGFRWQM